jgi:hypothetical protein
MARAASTLSPDQRTIRPQRVFFSAQASGEGQHDADDEQRVDLQRLLHLRDLLQPPRSSGRFGALGWM